MEMNEEQTNRVMESVIKAIAIQMGWRTQNDKGFKSVILQDLKPELLALSTALERFFETHPFEQTSRELDVVTYED